MIFRSVVERRLQLLIAIHIAIPAALLRQHIMIATLGDMSVLHHNNFTGFRQCRKAMGTDDYRSSLSPLTQVMQDLVLCASVHRRKRIIKDEDFRVD
ncbi:Uncharacterised protein [Shigella sonnei]|nr:Uncharacterised protein [Shigella sonnei]